MVTITISGTPGSGKSTVGRLLSEKIGLNYVYSGDIFRKTAKKYNMSLEEFGSYCETHKEVDKELDDYQLEILRNGNVIVEGRIAGWIAYRNNISALKVILDADIETRARRIVNRERGDVEKRKQEMFNREKNEALRYKNKRCLIGRKTRLCVIKNITTLILKIPPYMTWLLIPQIKHLMR
jgi:cytidylate kinase